MERYNKLLARYEKIKKDYQNNLPNDAQAKILLTIESGLNEFKNAILNNNNARILELSIKIKMFLDGFKIFPDNAKEKR